MTTLLVHCQNLLAKSNEVKVNKNKLNKKNWNKNITVPQQQDARRILTAVPQSDWRRPVDDRTPPGWPL